MGKVAPDDGKVSIPLLELEGADAMLMAGGITTITFFSCQESGLDTLTTWPNVDALKERYTAILEKNPWIAGRMTRKSKKERIQLVYDPEPTKSSGTNAVVEKGLFLNADPQQLSLSPEMEYTKLCKALYGSVAEVITGSKCLNKDEALCKLTVVPDSKNPASFALVFSLSHTIGDGHTYYMLFNMLSDNSGDVIALEPGRKEAFPGELSKAVGEVESKFWMRTSYMMNCIGNMVFGGKPKIHAYYVDAEKVKQQKESAKPSGDRGGAGFVSTNDLLTSSFGRMINGRLLEVAVNFRKRLSPADTDAGNYEGALYLGNEDFETPNLVRCALSKGDGTYKRCGADPPRPLPSGCEMARCRFGLITNWASFCKDIQLPNCTQSMHIPYFNPGEIPCEVCIVFKPTRDELAVLLFTRRVKQDVRSFAYSVFGNAFAPQIFPAAK